MLHERESGGSGRGGGTSILVCVAVHLSSRTKKQKATKMTTRPSCVYRCFVFWGRGWFGLSLSFNLCLGHVLSKLNRAQTELLRRVLRTLNTFRSRNKTSWMFSSHITLLNEKTHQENIEHSSNFTALLSALVNSSRLVCLYQSAWTTNHWPNELTAPHPHYGTTWNSGDRYSDHVMK